MTARAPSSIHVVSSRLEPDRLGAFASSPGVHCATALEELRGVLERTAELGASETRRLDLYGHSTRGANLLRLGKTAIDMNDASVHAFFQEVARTGLLRRTGITAVRLLGCATATTEAGQLTMRVLSRVLGVSVFGTTKQIAASHYEASGFNPLFLHLLVEASQVPRRGPDLS